MESGIGRFSFLYRQGEGFLSPREWVLASLPPTALLVAMTLIWLAIAPAGPRDLATQGFFDAKVFAAFVYLPFFTLAIFLCAAAQYFVSAKRLADRGMPPALAGLAPLSLLLAGAAHWYQPRSEGLSPAWIPLVFDALAVLAILWTIAELGFGASKRPKSL
jgi:uncharacterized membrane protein YhaH (DUF805 family)